MERELDVFNESMSVGTSTQILKKYFPDIKIGDEEKEFLKKIKTLLKQEYFYTKEEINIFIKAVEDMDTECLNAFLLSSNKDFKNVKERRWSIKKLQKKGYKLPECYLIISNLKKDYKLYSKELKKD